MTRGRPSKTARNLAPAFLDQIVDAIPGNPARPPGTRRRTARRRARRAVAARRSSRRRATRAAPELARIVVAIDPAASIGRAGRRDRHHRRRHGRRRARLCPGRRLGPLSPRPNGRATAIAAYRAHQADRIVAEVNNGGDMVEATLRMIDPDVPFRAVRASRGKVARAEPVAALYEQGRLHHLGAFPQLEDQMCAFTRGDFERAAARLFARPGRCAGLGADRAPGRAARRGRRFSKLIGGSPQRRTRLHDAFRQRRQHHGAVAGDRGRRQRQSGAAARAGRDQCAGRRRARSGRKTRCRSSTPPAPRRATAAARSRPAAAPRRCSAASCRRNGFLVQNNSSAALWISDVGTASAGGASIQLAANGGIFATPSG